MEEPCVLLWLLSLPVFSWFFKKSKREYNLNKPKFYLRYVDDILAAFNKEQNLLNFFKLFKYKAS